MYLEILVPLLILYLVHTFYWKRRNLPPGPLPWPYFGNIIEFLRKPVYQACIDWHKEYGPIHTFWMGGKPLVAISDYKLIQETFVKDAETYAGRPYINPELTTNFGRQGVVLTDGPLWRENRRFALHVLRNFGLGKNLMQERVMVEVSSLVEKVHQDISNGLKDHNIVQHIDVAVGSIINNLLFSYRFEGAHLQKFHELKRLIHQFISTTGHPAIQIFRDHIGLLKYLPRLNQVYYKLKTAKEELMKFYQKEVEEHQARIDHDSEPTDYVEAFLREKVKKEMEGNGEDEYYSMVQLWNMCADLWVAGQETTSNTLAWGILYLMQDQKIQDTLQKELDTVIGFDRLISMDDKPNLHYTSAVINEVQRIANLLPINVPHTTSRDVTIQGYKIPEGTVIIPHITVILYDDAIFPNPTKFDPTRFLDEHGKWKRVDELIPFSAGKRQCLGEGLARMELFLFVANIFNQFKITVSPLNPPDMTRKRGGTIAPQPFVCQIEKRH